MNGQPRDAIGSDLQAGLPTVSPSADLLAQRVVALMSDREAERLYNRIDHRVVRSPGWRPWTHDPTRYLSDFDGEAARAVESLLEAELRRVQRRAKARGWEVEDTTAISRDIAQR